MDPNELESSDAEILRETLDRKPSPYPRLLMWTPTDGVNARIDPSFISPAGMISDYFEFARTYPLPLGGHEPDLDRRVLPLLFLYRHATELALKYAIGQLRRHIRQREADFDCEIPEHHSLGNLVGRARALFDKAKGYLNEMGTVDFLSSQAQGFTHELDQLDPKGEAFRYSHRKREKSTGSVKPQIATTVNVSVEALRAGMLHVEKELLWFIDMIEITGDLYDEWTAEMLADAGW